MIPRNILFILQKLIQPTQTLEIVTFKKDLVTASEGGEVSPHDTKWLETQYSNEKLWVEVLKVIGSFRLNKVTIDRGQQVLPQSFLVGYKVHLEKIPNKSLCKHYIDDKIFDLKRPLARLYCNYSRAENLQETFNGSQDNLQKYLSLFPTKEKRIIMKQLRFGAPVVPGAFGEDPHTKSLKLKVDAELLPWLPSFLTSIMTETSKLVTTLEIEQRGSNSKPTVSD